MTGPYAEQSAHWDDRNVLVGTEANHYQIDGIPEDLAKSVTIRHPGGVLTLNIPEALNFQTTAKLKKLFDFVLVWQLENEKAVHTLDRYIGEYEAATNRLAAGYADKCESEWEDPDAIDASTKEGRAMRREAKARNKDRETHKNRTAKIRDKAARTKELWNTEKEKYS